MKKVLRKIFWALVVVLLIFITAGIVVSTVYKDELIAHVVRETNKSLNTPVQVGKIDVSIWHHFPRISVRFNDVRIMDSYPAHDSVLLKANRIDFSLNLFRYLAGDLVVDEMYLDQATCHLKMDASGTINYDIFKHPKKSSSTDPARLELSRVMLKEVDFDYENNLKEVRVKLYTKKMDASVKALGSIMDISAQGDVLPTLVQTGGNTYNWKESVSVDADLNYDNSEKILTINKSPIKVKNSDFLVTGVYAFKDTASIDLNIISEKSSVEALLTALPVNNAEQLAQYTSVGETYFSLHLNGAWQNNMGPALDIKFGLKGADIKQQKSGIKLKKVTLSGTLTYKDITDPSSAKIHLKNIQGILSGNSFQSNIVYNDLVNPYVNFTFDGIIDVASFLDFYPVKAISSGRGKAEANITFECLLDNLKRKSGLKYIKTSGEFNLEKIYLEFGELNTGLRNLNGRLLFNNNDLAVNDVYGKFGRSDFKLNGYFKNVIAYLLFDDEPVGIESSLQSHLIDMDELLSLTSSPGSDETQYSFKISNRLLIDFNCNIDRLVFRRFHPTKIRGDLKVKDKVAFTDNLHLNAVGGSLGISGMVDARKEKLLNITTHFTMDHMAIDSIFYVFENFQQNFLIDKHLKGSIYANADAKMMLSDKLHLYPETLKSNISTTIKNGELNNFEPMQRLAKYLDERKLEHLRFAELANDIVIRDKTIYLPQMEVGTNITDIHISGTHTFDQKINYSVAAPLHNPKKDSDEAFGAIEKDVKGRSMLFLKITGNTSDYYVSYDKDKVKQKIASDIKKEARELKEVFKNKGQKSETVELKEDDYFDWEEDN